MRVRRRRPGSTPPLVTPPRDAWKPGELDLRRREVAATEKTTRSQNWIQLAQVLAVLAALASTVVALYAARQSAAATESATESSTQQANETQLSTAISSLDTGDLFARTTKMLLIQRYVRGIMSLPLSTSEARQNAYGDYTTAFNTFSLYIKTHSPSPSPTFGPGYGIPSETPLDIIYAADSLAQLTSMGPKVAALHAGPSLFLNLTNAELYGLNLPELDISGFPFVFLHGVDLRTADLENARLEAADLSGAYLQCANLSGADLSGANLSGADLRGASVEGADFTGALMIGAKLGDMFGAAIGLPRDLVPAKSYDQTECARNKKFWDNAPPPGGGRK